MYRKERIIECEDYQVDTNGVVYSKKNKPLKYSINHNGYCIVNLMVNGKRIGMAIHSIVAKQFIPNSDSSNTQVNHKDGNKQNNNVENLEWCSPKQNVKHAINVLGKTNFGSNNNRAKKVVAYNKDGECVYEFCSVADAARYLNNNNENYRYKQSLISRVALGKRNTYKGFVWRYIP